MRFRIFLIAAMLMAATVPVAKAIRLSNSKQEQEIVKTPEATVKIFNNTIKNAWVNVPIQITSLGAHNYRVTSKSHMPIKRLAIALNAAYIGKPFHGEGAQQHFVPVIITD